MSARLSCQERAKGDSQSRPVTHTPGPWHTSGIFNPNGPRPTTWVWGPTPEGAQSGTCICKDITLPDARLITAAPELLALAKKMLAAWEGSGSGIVLDEIRTLIAQAEGRS